MTLLASRRALPANRTHGFTLIEAMIVVALAAILAALAAPSFTTMIANQRLDSAAQELHTLLQFARAEAVYKRTETAVTVTDHKWEAKAGVQVLRESVLSDAVTVEPGVAGGVTFDTAGAAKPATGNAPYIVKFSSAQATRVQCLRVTGPGLVIQQRVAAGQNCA